MEKELLKGLSPEEKFEICTRAIQETANRIVGTTQMLEAGMARFEDLLKSMAKILVEADRQKWEKAILEALDDGRP